MPVETGSIRTLIENYEVALTDSGNYAVPTAADLTAMRAIWDKLALGDVDGASTDASAYNYETVVFTDTETGRIYHILREKAIRTKWWGLFILSKDPGATNKIIAQVHTIADAHTHIQSAGIFISANARALLATGTHRNASATLDGDGDNITDVANASNPPSSVFQAIFERIDTVNDLVIEPHGFGSAEPMGSAHFVASSIVVLDPAGLSMTLPLPNGSKFGERPLKIGDTMFVLQVIRDSTATYTAPAGWTEISKVADGTGILSVVWTKVVTQSDLDSAGFTFTQSISNKAQALLVAYENCGAVHAFVTGTQASTTAVTAHSVGPVSTTIANTVLVSFFSVTNATSWGTASTTTKTRAEARTSATASSSSVIYDTNNAVQPAGSYSVTANNSTSSLNVAMHLIALSPAAVVRETNVIISHGAAPGGVVPAHVLDAQKRISDLGFSVVANDMTWTFAATGNVQGVYARSLGGRFLHVEQQLPLRSDLTNRNNVIKTLSLVGATYAKRPVARTNGSWSAVKIRKNGAWI